MKKYLSFFRLRFVMGLQYRAAAWAGVVTQFVWGVMEILMFRAFYEADPQAFPMSMEATASYIWMQQAFLAFFMVWFMENEIFDAIRSGNVAYELCRPIRIYHMWFARSLANRTSRAVLRCFPILGIAVFLPRPYGLCAPPGWRVFLLYLVSMALGLLVVAAFCMLIYGLTFFTVSPDGLRILFSSAVDFFAGAVIPIPFFPGKLRALMELLPFAAMQNVPLRVYSGDLAGEAAARAIGLQVFWLAVLAAAGEWLFWLGERKALIQGG